MRLPSSRGRRSGNRKNGLRRIGVAATLRGLRASTRRNLKGNPRLSNHNFGRLAMHHPGFCPAGMQACATGCAGPVSSRTGHKWLNCSLFQP